MAVILYFLLAVLICFLVYIFFLFACSLFVSPNKEYEKNSRFYRTLLNMVSGAVLKILRVKIHIRGIEKIPQNRKLVFVGNHMSNFDPIITWYVFRKWNIAYLSKDRNFRIPIFGRFIRKCCFMAIDRENPRNALKTINKAVNLIKADEVSIGVYPEGTRSKTGELLPFHDGVFRIAIKSEVPIVVIKLTGTNEIYNNICKRKSNICLEVVDIIENNDAKTLGTHGIGKRIREKLGNKNEEENV